MKHSDTNRIIDIGKNEKCTDEDLHYFLPNFPNIHGSEDIFSIGWTGGNRFINEQVEYFIKGLHLIENKYKAESKNESGFGSPSPSFMVISCLKRTNEQLAYELEEWIRLTGGNYYIKVNLKDKTNDQRSLFD